ncbi:terpene synthase family protein [Kitasatospora sp. NPDC058263]
MLHWARENGLVATSRDEQRLAAMRIDVLARHALPQGDAADVELTARWAVFICWLDDQIDRRGLGSAPGELERFAAPLREVLAREAGAKVTEAAAPHERALAQLWERTAAGMPDRWRRRFAADYGDFLDACEEETALRRSGERLTPAAYVGLRRRTITLLPMLNVLERTGHATLVEDPRVDAQLRDLRLALADVAGWANDLASHPADTAAAQDSLVSLLALHHGCTTAEATVRTAEMIGQRRAEFRASAELLRTKSVLPEPLLHELRAYVDLVETFMGATLHWLETTGRFAPDRLPEPGPPERSPHG